MAFRRRQGEACWVQWSETWPCFGEQEHGRTSFQSTSVMKQERHPPYVSTTLPYHERVPFAFLLLVPSTRSRFRIDIYR